MQTVAAKTRRQATLRGPQPIGKIINELMARQGVGRQLAAQQRQQAWQQAVGQPLAGYTRCGSVYRRRLEVIVASSTLMQELTFQKPQILQRLREIAPELEVDDIRFRQGTVQ
jgi:predicted nucleic acid-binding Zn ribbon protein